VKILLTFAATVCLVAVFVAIVKYVLLLIGLIGAFVLLGALLASANG
jgi:hypothetical protein